jgi:hypothetical protein
VNRVAILFAASLVLPFLVTGLAASTQAADPLSTDAYQAAHAHRAEIGNHLVASLESANVYERLLALEYIQGHPAAATPDLARPLAALATDRHLIPSEHCMACRSQGLVGTDACWGMYGNSDCGYLREVRTYAGPAVASLTQGPLRAPLTDALWAMAIRSPDAAVAVADLMPRLAPVFQQRVTAALEGPEAGRAAQLLARFPPDQCRDASLAPILRRQLALTAPLDRVRAGVAILVCSDTTSAWAEARTAAVDVLARSMAETPGNVLGEIPREIRVVEPLTGPIGRRMANRAAPDAAQGASLLSVAQAPDQSVLPGVRARLEVAVLDESVDLLQIIRRLGPRAASLKPAILACARRDGVSIQKVIEALADMRVRLTHEDRMLLKRIYHRQCDNTLVDDCEPFSSLMKSTSSHR